jgi:hypothetical protein
MNTSDPAVTSLKTVNLKALCNVSLEHDLVSLEDTFRCEHNEAMNHIENGRAELTKRQDVPPSFILRELELKLEHLDCIGFEWRDGTRLQKFQDGAIVAGARRAMVEGEKLDWIEGIQKLRKAFTAAFQIGETSLGEILSQLEECWLFKKTSADKRTARTSLTDNEMIEQGLVCFTKHPSNFLNDVHSGGYELFDVGGDWAQFYLDLQRIKHKLEQALIECLCTGRVLSVLEKPFGSTLILPSHWDENRLRNPKEGNLIFVFSHNFPAAWYHALETLPSIKAKAIKWLERAEKKLDGKNIRASQSDCESIIIRKFELSTNAAKDVWKQADRIYKGVSGNIPEPNRATKLDLLEIEQDN